MEPLLFLTHRIPYPPNKGDKIRSFNLLRHLNGRYRVHLGCFVDSPDDRGHVATLSDWCADVCTVRLEPRRARLRSLSGLLSGDPLTLPYYASGELRRWVHETVAREKIRKVVVFSSAMAQYVLGLPGVHTVIDLVDVDSAKWTAYAAEHRWPLSAVYRREGARLLAFERRAVAQAAAAVLVTRAERDLFGRLAPECAAKVHAIENGVDGVYFAPSEQFASPFEAGEAPLVFTGAMDYWPNVDAVTWFARDVLPTIVQRRPEVRFTVVGMNPSPAVRALARDPHVRVTGTVPDVRPYLQHAAAVVAPLRVARGVQNKVLEAMAMGRPVVTSVAAAAGIAAQAGVELEAAGDAQSFAERTLAVLDPGYGAALGARARRRICSGYRWESNMAQFSELLEGVHVAAVDPSPTTQPLALAG